MKPRDLFLAGLEAQIAPRLEGLGFRFSRSKVEFKRTVPDGFRQRIGFSLSKWNEGNRCEFWSNWAVSASRYVDWFRTEWNKDPPSDLLAQEPDWSIPAWIRGAEDHLVLLNQQSDTAEWAAFLRNVERAGMPFLESVSSWEGAANHLRRQRWQFDRAADFLIIAGCPQHAHQTLLEGLHTFEVDGRPDSFHELPRLKVRLERYFAGVRAD